jgi:hypothetical protein
MSFGNSGRDAAGQRRQAVVFQSASARAPSELPPSVLAVARAVELSEAAREVIASERDTVAARVADLRRQSDSLHTVVDQVDDDLARAERLLRRMDEMLGLAPQLAIEDLGEELRGRRLREVAVQVLRVRQGLGTEIHYTEWLGLVRSEGVRVGGKNPAATFLTQITKAPEVECVRPRSGRYRLRAA